MLEKIVQYYKFIKLINFIDIKNKLKKKENIFFFLFIIIIFLLDRFSKIQVIKNYNQNIHFVNDYLNLDLIWNIGIGFGILSTDSTIIYNLITCFIGLVIFILLNIMIISEKLDKIIYSLILGGAFGNFYDRLIFQAVPDFIDVHYQNFHWFTFNVADIFITLGILIFICKGIFIKG